MVDVVNKATRSRMMAGIGSKDTSPELAVRRFLYAAGLRYRLHVRGLPGRPDIVFSRLKTVVFVHGCFWHRHSHCKYAYTPKSNKVFWNKKFSANIKRDFLVRKMLAKAGWRVFVVWECMINEKALSSLFKKLINLRSPTQNKRAKTS